MITSMERFGGVMILEIVALDRLDGLCRRMMTLLKMNASTEKHLSRAQCRYDVLCLEATGGGTQGVCAWM